MQKRKLRLSILADSESFWMIKVYIYRYIYINVYIYNTYCIFSELSASQTDCSLCFFEASFVVNSTIRDSFSLYLKQSLRYAFFVILWSVALCAVSCSALAVRLFSRFLAFHSFLRQLPPSLLYTTKLSSLLLCSFTDWGILSQTVFKSAWISSCCLLFLVCVHPTYSADHVPPHLLYLLTSWPLSDALCSLLLTCRCTTLLLLCVKVSLCRP